MWKNYIFIALGNLGINCCYPIRIIRFERKARITRNYISKDWSIKYVTPKKLAVSKQNSLFLQKNILKILMTKFLTKFRISFWQSKSVKIQTLQNSTGKKNSLLKSTKVSQKFFYNFFSPIKFFKESCWKHQGYIET